MIAIRPLFLAALALLPAACGSSSPVPVPVRVAEPSPDGTWRGTSTRFQAESRSCPHPGLVTLKVLEERFQFRWDSKTWIDATIDPDGSIHGSWPGITLVGKRTGARIEGDVTNGDCGLHFTVVKKDN
jgi:hypothetical protein